MKLSKTAAERLVKEACAVSPDTGWARHSFCVGDTAERIAEKLKAKHLEIDSERAAALGYVHDIGKRNGSQGFVGHMLNGYDYLTGLGYDEADANICRTHSFLRNKDPFCTISSNLDADEDAPLINFLKNHDLSLTEQLVALCDAMCLFDVMTVEERLVDVVSRHGAGESTQQAFLAAMELKEKFSQLIGQNIYSLFPEIKARF